jgi:carboxymethylenebutenolidase
MTDDYQFQGNGEILSGALVRPEGAGPWPGLVVVQEWWGLVPHIRNVASRFAKAGYLALAPDLYMGESAFEPEGCTKLAQKHGAAAPARARAAFQALKAHPDCSGKVGVVGYCFGGRMALHVACYEPELDAAAVYYGGRMEQYFDRVPNICCPVLGVFGAEDRGIPAESVQRLDDLLDEAGVPHEVIVYPGAAHAFFNDEGSNYNGQAAADAWRRTTAFFSQYLT